MKYFLLLVLHFIVSAVIAQEETAESRFKIKYEPGFDFKPGIYLSKKDFLNNSPFVLDSVQFSIDEEPSSFLSRVFTKPKLVFVSAEKTDTVKAEDVWGYSDGRDVYVCNHALLSAFENATGSPFKSINWIGKNGLSRIDMIGSLSILMFVKTTQNSTGRDPISGTPYTSPSTSTIKRYIYNLQTDEMMELTMRNIQAVIQREPALLKYSPPSGSKESRMYYYLMEYNRKHPIYFPE